MADSNGENTEEQIFMDVTGTVLDPVARVLVAGEFTGPDRPVGEGEKVIGEFTDFEKAVYTVYSTLWDECAAIAKSGDADSNIELMEKPAQVVALRELLNASARRLGAVSWEGKGIAFCKGYKIVSVPNSLEDEELEKLRSTLSGMMGI
jgi:hypothetical protein